MLRFEEGPHKYYHRESGLEYISATTVLGRYKNEFDTDRIAGEYAENHPELNMTKAEVIAMWDKIKNDALHKGNKWHFEQELQDLYNFAKLDREYNDSITDLSKLTTNTYPELRLWWDEYMLAGTADKVVIMGDVAHVFDHKTNKRILRTKGFKGQMMLRPLQYLPDAEYYHYELQLNIYAWILWKNGFKIGRIAVEHVRWPPGSVIPDTEFKPFINRDKQEKELREPRYYEFEFLPHRVEAFLKHDWNKRKRELQKQLDL